MFGFMYDRGMLTQDTFLSELRATTSMARRYLLIKKHPEYINAALNDEKALAVIGGPEGVRRLAVTDIGVCDAIIASDLYKTFEQVTREQIESSRGSLQRAILSKNVRSMESGKKDNPCVPM